MQILGLSDIAMHCWLLAVSCDLSVTCVMKDPELHHVHAFEVGVITSWSQEHVEREIVL